MEIVQLYFSISLRYNDPPYIENCWHSSVVEQLFFRHQAWRTRHGLWRGKQRIVNNVLHLCFKEPKESQALCRYDRQGSKGTVK